MNFTYQNVLIVDQGLSNDRPNKNMFLFQLQNYICSEKYFTKQNKNKQDIYSAIYKIKLRQKFISNLTAAFMYFC